MERSGPDPVERWLARFREQRPDLDPAAFGPWARTQPELAQRAELRERIEEVLVRARSAERLLGTTRGPPTFHRRRDGGGAPQEDSPEERNASLRPGRRLGPFVLRSFLARGGMGQVWEAEDTSLRRRVALKLVLPGRIDTRVLELFSREARAGGRLVHPNIVRTLAYGTDEGLAWIAQELVEGSWTLKDFLDELRTADALPPGYYRSVAELVAQIGDALRAVHEAGVIHRDIKPANILIAPDDTPRLTDFGVARVADDPLLSVSGELTGTWAYMSPEQVTASRSGLDHRSDVFSLGVVLYELLTLRRPFEGDTTHQIGQQILHDEPPDPCAIRSLCPRELAVICLKALEKQPSARYPSAAELAADLRRHLANEPIRAQPPGPVTRVLKWSRRNRGKSAGAVGALLSVGLISAVAVVAIRKAEDAVLAQRAADAEREDVLRLSISQDLDDLLAAEGALWPPYPAQLEACRDWLNRAAKLLAEMPRLVAKREELRALALPRTEDERLSERAQHPEFPRLAELEAELGAKARALAARRGEPRAELPELETSNLPADRSEWDAIAWELVKPERTHFGEEGRGVRLVEAALAGAEDWVRASLLDTLAWGLLALGDDEGAVSVSRDALDAASPAKRAEYRGLLDQVLAVSERARSPEGLAAAAAELARLQQERDALDRRLDERQQWSYPTGEEDARWWNAQLTRLIAGLESLRDDLVAPDAVTREHGWSVGKRLAFARSLEAGFAPGGEFASAWERDLPAIRATYPGLELARQMGLVPLGPDPDSGLWEFAHLASGEPARRDADGRLVLTEASGLVLVLLPAGTFPMGAQAEDPDAPCFSPQAPLSEGPVNEVQVTPFLLSKYELTQAQWLRATGHNPSRFGPDGSFGLEWNHDGSPASRLHPVELVSWRECVALCERLALELPSEAHWEYGCRAGTQSAWWCGDEVASLVGVGNVADQYARQHGGEAWAFHEAIDDGYTSHAEIGRLRPNAFGLHDVHGNVSEWCQDGYNGSAYNRERTPDPLVSPELYPSRVLRGGSFNAPANSARSGYRGAESPDFRLYSLGLRPAASLRR